MSKLNIKDVAIPILEKLEALDMQVHEMPVDAKECYEVYHMANKDGFRFFNDFRSSHFVMDQNGNIACIGNLLGINAQLNTIVNKLDKQA